MIATSPFESFFLEVFGLKEVTGTYMNWMTYGFNVWIDDKDLPIMVVTRKDTFDDYPGDNDPKEGKTVHVIGQSEPDGFTIHAVKWWFDLEKNTPYHGADI
jgi:hypothetical protein